jgi:hypothetical protein
VRSRAHVTDTRVQTLRTVRRQLAARGSLASAVKSTAMIAPSADPGELDLYHPLSINGVPNYGFGCV